MLTGGEPFVYFRDLQDILEATAGCGLAFRIVTAAHWARSLPEARQKLVPLRERGLTELSVSTDPSHQAFVPATFAENAATAAHEIGIAAELAGVFWDAGTRVEDVVQVPEGVSKMLPDFDPFLTPCQLCALVHSDPALLDALDPVLGYADKLFGAVEDLCRQEARPREEVPRA